jgi:hypothetical protein
MGAAIYVPYVVPPKDHPHALVIRSIPMLGMLVISDDGDIACAIYPHPELKDTLLLFVQFYDLEVPPIPVPLSDLRTALEVWFGKSK